MATPAQLLPTPAPAIAKAGFWIRVAAYLVDGIILFIVVSVVNLVVHGNSSTRFGLNLVIGAVYFIYFWSSSSVWPGQTVGMKILNLRVVRTDGSNLTYVQGLVRYLGLWVATIPVGLGLAWVGWDPNKQGWHDKMARTWVLRS